MNNKIYQGGMLMKGTYVILVAIVLAFSAGAKAELKPYGTIRVDASKDSSGRLDNTLGDQSQSVTDITQSTYTMHARATTFGVVGSSTAGNLDLDGKLQVDFFGSPDSTNAIAHEMEIVYAYIHAHCNMTGLNLTVGQTSDVVSPLNPTILNNNLNLASGNIGNYRPQLLLSRDFFKVLRLEAAVAKPSSSRESAGLDKTGRVSVMSGDLFGPFATTAGFGVVRGKELRTTRPGTRSRPYNYDLGNTDLYENPVVVNAADFTASAFDVAFQFEAYNGENVNHYGGLATYDTTKYANISEKGYWWDLSYTFSDYKAYLGFSKAHVDLNSVDALTTGITYNSNKWVGVEWRATKSLKVGFDYSILSSRSHESALITAGRTEQTKKSERYQLMVSYDI